MLLLAGLLDPATYLGGTLPLHPDRSAKVIETNIAGPLGIPLDDALRHMEEAHAAAIAHALAALPPSTAAPRWPRSAARAR